MKTPTFAGKVAAVTGAGSGIGRSLATALARRGCEVALSDVDERGLAETVAMCSGVKVTSRRVDVAKAADVRAWADEVARAHGRANLIFNNAGISYAATVAGYEDADFARVIDVDFWGVVNGTRAFLPHLERAGDGHVINTSSVFGLIGFPAQCSYNSAKFAVRGFTESLQLELEITRAPIHATSVHPGGIKTNIARASKTHPSVASLGVKLEGAAERFEKGFRMTPDDAAETILRGVQRNQRRVLVGADAHVIDLVQRLIPGRYQGLLVRLYRRAMAAQ
jgi:NAD(P)-dependent dehydrogenase (short-subunit alcohol dehydrogenase family)